MKRTPLKRRSGGLKRTPLKRGKSLRAQPQEPLTADQADLRAAWIKAVVPRRARCAVCGEKGRRGDPLQGHHVAEQQVLENRAKDLGLDPEQIVWDPDAGMPVHRSEHEAHTNGSHRLPRSSVPGNCLAYLTALNLAWVLDRKYRDG